MNLDILVEQTSLLVKRRKQTSETAGKFACRAHQRRRLYYELNRKFKFLQDGNSELWRDPAAAACESRLFVRSVLFKENANKGWRKPPTCCVPLKSSMTWLKRSSSSESQVSSQERFILASKARMIVHFTTFKSMSELITLLLWLWSGTVIFHKLTYHPSPFRVILSGNRTLKLALVLVGKFVCCVAHKGQTNRLRHDVIMTRWGYNQVFIFFLLDGNLLTVDRKVDCLGWNDTLLAMSGKLLASSMRVISVLVLALLFLMRGWRPACLLFFLAFLWRSSASWNALA